MKRASTPRAQGRPASNSLCGSLRGSPLDTAPIRIIEPSGETRYAALPAANARRRDIGRNPATSTCSSGQSIKSTGVPLWTSLARASASQLVIRTQPCDSVLLTFCGCGVP